MSDIVSTMKSVNTRELQKHTREVRERVAAGESLKWVMGEDTVAYITPAQERKEPKPWPNLEARRRAIFGDSKEPQTEAGAQIVDEGRGDY
ncbi:MAG: antitoxin (DNA-binding transcriptional repressor) of toxin-antitoxin stability system [Candidatus Azotimanducaceae bacterium]|jgi:antitoxin (DNA-binding transcriptional repressor) of toxin-antitoxin stability system